MQKLACSITYFFHSSKEAFFRTNPALSYHSHQFVPIAINQQFVPSATTRASTHLARPKIIVQG
jgi:hypothetical protein